VREALVIWLYGTSRRSTGGLAKTVARKVEKGEPPTSFGERLEMRSDKADTGNTDDGPDTAGGAVVV
jgi:hypothetical protein